MEEAGEGGVWGGEGWGVQWSDVVRGRKGERKSKSCCMWGVKCVGSHPHLSRSCGGGERD